MSDRAAGRSGRLPVPAAAGHGRPHPGLPRLRRAVLGLLGDGTLHLWELSADGARPLGAAASGASPRAQGLRILRLPERSGLLVHELLPPALAGHVDEVIVQRLPELLPWPPERVRTVHWVTGRDAAGVHVAVAALPEERLARALERARELGFEPDLVDFVVDDPLAPPRFDLLGRRARRPAVHRVALAVALLLVLAAGSWLLWEEQRRARLDAAAAALRDRVADLAELRARADALEARIEAVRAHVAAHPGRLALVDRLARLLPDGVWLERLVVEGNRVRLHGYAPDSAALVRLFEETPGFTGTRFLAPSLWVRPAGAERPLERFVLETVATDPEAER